MIARGITAMLAAAGLAFAIAVPAAGASGGDNNKGDVWVDNVGQPSGPGHEQDPHLQCQDINLWGDKLADPSGTYTIDGWNPSGTGDGNQAWPGTKANPGNASWSYDQKTGGSQVISVIDVHKLVDNARANGDAPVNKQGLHFKLQFSQDPQKHKTFWVNCTPPTAQPGGGVSGAGASRSSQSPTGSGVQAASTSIPSLPRAGASAAVSARSTPIAILATLIALATLGGSFSLGLVDRLTK
jgi:hypothetical protein